MSCYFCENQIQSGCVLCFSCFSAAFETAKKHYETDQLDKLIELSRLGYEGDAITFVYATETKAHNKDMSGGEFIIDKCGIIMDVCKVDNWFWPKFFQGYIELSVSKFWSQAYN